MIELPEAITIGKQVQDTLVNLTITEVLGPTHLHKFTFFNSDPNLFRDLLVGKQIKSAEGKGIFVDIRLSDNTFLSIFDGINMKYAGPNTEIPDKYQLLITFDNDTFISFTTRMYGGIYVFKDSFDKKYRTQSLESISPLCEEFNQAYFEELISKEKKDISAKALLASEQRIPGVGNGVLQDILFNAGIHPKRKIFSLSDREKSNLFQALKNTLQAMTDGGGRDTESDFFGNKGKYKTILSKNTYGMSCPHCNDKIHKDAYMGGSVYFCPTCQKL